MLRGYNYYGFEYDDQQFSCYRHGPVVEDPVYGSDEFRMYAFKIKRCAKARSHDWTECPFAHRGEKARRRDPRRFEYCAVACPAFRGGCCPKGDACEFAHGVFEYWLHPARYRTRACNAGRFCRRKVCFFAHSPGQLRPVITRCDHGRERVELEAAGRHVTSPSPPPPGMESNMTMGSSSPEGVSEFLKSLRNLKISDGNDERFDLPEIEWVLGQGLESQM